MIRKPVEGRTMKTKMIRAAALGVLLLTSACSDPLLPAAPVPAFPTVSEAFTGTLGPQSTNTHQFAVTQVGGVKVTLLDVEPSAAIGIGIGTPSSATASCLVASSTLAVAGTSVLLSGTATVTGNFCISVSDVGNLVEPVTYSITVIHS
jgi:hypothetical protein